MEDGQLIFVGNIKGGVGKSTITTLLFDYFKNQRPKQKIQVLDTDRQGTSFELLEPLGKGDQIRHVPVSDRFDGLSLVTLDSILRRMRANTDTLTLVDTGAGWPGNIWQMAMMGECIIVPTSLSWADVRPTIEFVREMDERKASMDSVKPHIIIVPNRIPPAQRDLSALTDSLQDMNVVLAPPLSDLSIVRNLSSNFNGLKSAVDSRFYTEFMRLGAFLENYVLSGKLDQIYREKE